LPKGESDSEVENVRKLFEQNITKAENPEGLYKLRMISYDNKNEPQIPIFDQYKYVSKNASLLFIYKGSEDKVQIMSMRDDIGKALRYTGDTPQGANGLGERIYDCGDKGFKFKWYNDSEQGKYFPKDQFITEWYGKENIPENVERIISLMRKDVKRDKNNKLVGIWHKVGDVINVAGKEMLKEGKNDEYVIFDKDVLLMITISDIQKLRSTLIYSPIHFTQNGFIFPLAKEELKMEWLDDNTFKAFSVDEDSKVHNEIWELSPLPENLRMALE
jgi:hypothetical protein